MPVWGSTIKLTSGSGRTPSADTVAQAGQTGDLEISLVIRDHDGGVDRGAVALTVADNQPRLDPLAITPVIDGYAFSQITKDLPMVALPLVTPASVSAKPASCSSGRTTTMTTSVP